MGLLKSRRVDLQRNLEEDRWTKAGAIHPLSSAKISVLWNCWISTNWKRKTKINADGGSSKEMAETSDLVYRNYLKIYNAEWWMHTSI